MTRNERLLSAADLPGGRMNERTQEMTATAWTTRAIGRTGDRHARGRGGFALLAVMWVVLIAGLIVLGTQKAGRTNLAMAGHELARVRAHWLARAGVESAMAALDDDIAGGDDGTWDTWYSDGDSFEEVKLLGGSFSVTAPPGADDDPSAPRFGVIDHSGLLNLNVADATALKAMDILTDGQIASLLDWRDEDNTVAPGGAEGLFYRRLPFGYETRDGPLLTVREAALVHGMTGDVLWGEDLNDDGILGPNEDDLRATYPPDDGDGELARGLAGLTTVWSYVLNRNAAGMDRVNLNSADSQTIMARLNVTEALAEAIAGQGGKSTSLRGGTGPKSGGRFNSLMDLLKVKAKPKPKRSGDAEDAEDAVGEVTLRWLADYIDEMTLTDDKRLVGRININTAPREVLMTLPGMTAVTAQAIMRRRTGGQFPFAGVGELLTSETVTDEQFKGLAERVTVRSSVFEIRSTGVTTWGVRQTIVAVVDRGSTPMKILYWYQSE